ncbi:MAG: ComF family protein [Desulfobacterales bacterium]|nr:ComF family protein [Desulfobacterales bacterium]
MDKTGFTALRQAVREICFPSSCLGCAASLAGRSPPYFCPACAREIIAVRQPFCPVCGRPFFSASGPGHLCGTCLATGRNFSRARAVALYQGALVQAIHTFKYTGHTGGLSSFAVLKDLLGPGDLLRPDLIVPVPLHPRRLKERGFNQALLLARAFFPARRHRIVAALLQRKRYTPPQTTLSGPARRKNVRSAFRVKAPAQLVGQTVLLVDDVYTTGATVDECARVLVRAGARKVEVLTLARVNEEM